MLAPLAPLHPDLPLGAGAGAPDAATGPLAVPAQDSPLGRAFGDAVAEASTRLTAADHAESAFVRHRGSLQAMVVERARADVALALATAAASRTTQALTTILGMQV